MKRQRRRALVITMVTLFLVASFSAWLIHRASECQQASQVLIVAIKNGNLDAALAALNSGADPNTRDEGYEGSQASVSRLKAMLDKLLHRTTSTGPDTALMLSLKKMDRDEPKLVHALLDAGADPNATAGPDRESPLMRAACGKYPRTLYLLLQRGARVNQKSTHGVTPLHMAALCGDGQAVQLLLDAGADINATNDSGDTPLHYGAFNYNQETVATLLRNHACVNARNRRGQTPCDYATRNPSIGFPLNKEAKTGRELDAEAVAQAAKGR